MLQDENELSRNLVFNILPTPVLFLPVVSAKSLSSLRHLLAALQWRWLAGQNEAFPLHQIGALCPWWPRLDWRPDEAVVGVPLPHSEGCEIFTM